VEFGLTGREGLGSRRPIEPGVSCAKSDPRFREDRLPGRGRAVGGRRGSAGQEEGRLRKRALTGRCRAGERVACGHSPGGEKAASGGALRQDEGESEAGDRRAARATIGAWRP